MVRRKLEVLEWFRDLDSSSRIDVVCSILLLCSPWELRFYGTFLENLARKDYNHLRDLEIKANDLTELQRLSSKIRNAHAAHIDIRKRLIVSLSLMHSRPTNILCTSIIHQLLCAMQEHIEMIRFDSPIDEAFIADIRLLLTIAIRHPAFTFSQHQDFENLLEAFNQVFREDSDDPFSSMVGFFTTLICAFCLSHDSIRIFVYIHVSLFVFYRMSKTKKVNI